MKTAIAELESLSPYGQSRYYKVPALEKEGKDAYEERTWRERMHVDSAGRVFIPPMAFKNCLSEAAKFTSTQIPGKGKSTYTKHFEAGVMVTDGLTLPNLKADVDGLWLFVPGDGVRGGGKRVMKCFPVIPAWKGSVSFHVLDETVTESVFMKTLKEAGSFIGIGFFRPRNNGYYGRFKVNSLKWN